MWLFRLSVLFCALGLATLAPAAFAASGNGPNACQRPAAGSVVTPPVDLYSQDGVLNVALEYRTSLDDADRTLFCLVTPEGIEAPTLHVKPGETLKITLKNRVPALPASAPTEMMSTASDRCGSPTLTGTSVNLHFHGTNTRPVCHSDEVVHTLINSGKTFRYSVTFPRDEPPGLYWYHPHVHGISEAALLGGATGAIVVDGIENIQPAVAGLPARVLVIRDQNVAGNPTPGGPVPAWDLTLNYVAIAYPALTPAVIEIAPGRKEFWRVANTSADTVADLQLSYDGVVQPLEVVALDGVPTGSQDGTRRGRTMTASHLLLPTAGRAEFIITAPSASVRRAILETLAVDTGPIGDNDTRRTLAVLRTGDPQARDIATMNVPVMPQPSVLATRQRFEELDSAPITVRRKLYFSEVLSDPTNPLSPTNFFITVDGATPVLFHPSNPPAITTTQGSVEEWTIENRAGEVHEFHMHQIHFQLRKRDNVPVAAADRQFFDTIQIPYWTGTGPYPSVTVAMDFRGNIVGDIPYHCHILGHEDNGMMAVIRVVRPPG